MLSRSAVEPVVIASPNGHFYNGGELTAIVRAYQMIASGADVLESLIAGVNIVELDPEDSSIGYGGLPNADGVVQLDACCMHGPTKRAGGVAALEGVRTPSLVAQRGDGPDRSPSARRRRRARRSRATWGSPSRHDLNTEHSRTLWLEWKRRIDPSTTSIPEAGAARAWHEGPGCTRWSRARARSDRRTLLGHDQLQRHRPEGRSAQRDHDERPGLEDPRARGRLADSRRRAVRRQRRRRRRIHRARRGEPLQPLLVPDRRGDAPRPDRRKTPGWKR